MANLSAGSEIFAVDPTFAKKANLQKEQYQELVALANTNYPQFWADLATKYISFEKNFTTILNQDNPPFFKWFEDGALNVSYNCLDRHLAKNGEKIAIIFEADDGSSSQITYRQLYHEVCRFANGLKKLGVLVGDRVIIYMPHSIEAVIAMQACARIGATHSVVFAGFSAKSLAERIEDADAKFIITANGTKRGGKNTYLKAIVDEAVSLLSNSNTINKIVVQKRTDDKVLMLEGRDVYWEDLVVAQDNECPATIIPSEHPLFLLYTSGSTGKPKGIQHASAGYLLGCIVTMMWVFDFKMDDIFWCTADVGWITGHSYVCYGPLAVGATQVIYEGVPTYPDYGRFWQIIQKYRVTTFYTAPTALRSLIKSGEAIPNSYDLSSLRLLGSVGEPINPEVWLWFYKVIGKSSCPIVDTWWQTETGCNMLSPLPGVSGLKPGSCAMPIPGIIADIVKSEDNDGEEHGYLVIKEPFPSQVRTIWNNPERFKSAYYPKEVANGAYYVAGDAAVRDKDGYFWILGRTDDVLNVSGHRLGSAEIESALVSHPSIAEAAVVGKPHAIKGESACAFVVIKANVSIIEIEQFKKELQNFVAKEISPIAKPDDIYIVEALPKTRSGKIMRRLLRNIAHGQEISSDVSTLENPAVLEQIKVQIGAEIS